MKEGAMDWRRRKGHSGWICPLVNIQYHFDAFVGVVTNKWLWNGSSKFCTVLGVLTCESVVGHKTQQRRTEHQQGRKFVGISMLIVYTICYRVMF